MERTKTYIVDANKKEVVANFANLHEFATRHPLILGVSRVCTKKGDEHFNVLEKPFKWIPMRLSYNAEIKRNQESYVEYVITGILWTKINIQYEFSEKPRGQTQVDVCIKILSKLVGTGILMNKMFGAQDEVMASFKNNT